MSSSNAKIISKESILKECEKNQFTVCVGDEVYYIQDKDICIGMIHNNYIFYGNHKPIKDQTKVGWYYNKIITEENLAENLMLCKNTPSFAKEDIIFKD